MFGFLKRKKSEPEKSKLGFRVVEKRKHIRYMNMDVAGNLVPIAEIGFSFESNDPMIKPHREVYAISYGGFGVQTYHDDEKNIRIGDKLAITTTLKGLKMPMTVSIRHINKKMIGLKIVEATDEHLEELRKFLEPRHMGGSLVEISTKLLKQKEPGITRRWFHGENKADLFLSYDGTPSLVKFQFNFLKHVIQWEKSGKLKTGTSKEILADSFGYGNEVLVDLDIKINRDILTLGIEILRASKIDLVVTSLILRMLNEQLSEG